MRESRPSFSTLVPRELLPEALGKLKPAFKLGGTVTAGNSSQLSDGAAAVMLMTPEKADELGIGPVKAVPKVLERCRLTLDRMEVIELNEAVAAQSLSVIERLGLDPRDERLNPNGGAIALGHPLGCTGAKLAATAIHELRRCDSRYAMLTMCIGLGMGAAGIFERAWLAPEKRRRCRPSNP